MKTGTTRLMMVASMAGALIVSAPIRSHGAVIRGPYLQLATPQQITIQWRTDVPEDSVVRYGLTTNALSGAVTNAALVSDHKVTLSSLVTGATYYYDFGSTTQLYAIAAERTEYRFLTTPLPTTPGTTRIWVLGDSGVAGVPSSAVRDYYYQFNGGDSGADVWIMLGDNAYNDGTDAQFQAALFDVYPDTLRRVALWSTFGNHESYSGASSATETGPYYDIFTFPRNAEAGGVPSGTEAYYSFDYANIHFICLNSMDIGRYPEDPMGVWLQSDLQNTEREWIIAFWHHPPYTKGSHDSDTEKELLQMRQHMLPILENGGIDLVLCGHSHSYERSYYVNGHYHSSGTFNPATMALDTGNGQSDGDGAYQRNSDSTTGAVYVVAGSSSKLTATGPLNHPVMFTSMLEYGSFVVDVSSNTLDATFLGTNGVLDHFTIQKPTPPADTLPPALLLASQTADASVLNAVFNEPLLLGAAPTSASNTANYSVPGHTVINALVSADARRVALTLSPPLGDYSLNTLYVSNVADRAELPNVMAGVESFVFRFIPPPEDLTTWPFKMAIATPGAPASPLVDFPLLVTLSESIPGLSYDQFASPRGEDLRFSLQGSSTPVPHEIELWNPGGESKVWVRVPALSSATTIVAYWGNPGTRTPPSSLDGSTWVNGYAGVYHFNEPGLKRRRDSSATGNDAWPGRLEGDETTPALIGNGVFLDGVDDAMAITENPSLDFAARMTLSAWFNASSWSTNPPSSVDNVILRKENSYRLYNREGNLSVKLQGVATAADPNPITSIATGTWHYVVVVHDTSAPSANLRLYLNNALIASANTTAPIIATHDELLIGLKTDGTQPFHGYLDEIRLASVARSDTWIDANWRMITDPGTFLSYGAVEKPAASDLDGDQLPDWWEILHFYNPTNGVTGEDGDGDGLDNGSEYLAGTLPTNDRSVLLITNLSVDVLSQAARLEWPSRSDRTYSLLLHTNLLTPPEVAAGNIAGQSGSTLFLTNITGSATGYYRLTVRP